MHWDLGSSGLLYLAATSIVFGLLAQLLPWRAVADMAASPAVSR